MIDKRWWRLAIASQHDRWPARAIARAAEKYLSAYNNIFNWDMATNGELRALRVVMKQAVGDVFDVGANAGQWALAALPHLDGRRLHCFEPVPSAFAALSDALPASASVVLNPIGLSDTPGTVELNYSAKATTISSSFELIFPDPEQERIPCRFTTGDAYTAEHDIAEIAFVKIDVEGMEMAVLQGLTQACARRQVAAIQFEHGSSHIFSGHTLKSFIDELARFDFDIFFIFPKSLVQITYSFDLENYGGQNLLAVRRDVAQRLGD